MRRLGVEEELLLQQQQIGVDSRPIQALAELSRQSLSRTMDL